MTHLPLLRLLSLPRVCRVAVTIRSSRPKATAHFKLNGYPLHPTHLTSDFEPKNNTEATSTTPAPTSSVPRAPSLSPPASASVANGGSSSAALRTLNRDHLNLPSIPIEPPAPTV